MNWFLCVLVGKILGAEFFFFKYKLNKGLILIQHININILPC